MPRSLVVVAKLGAFMPNPANALVQISAIVPADAGAGLTLISLAEFLTVGAGFAKTHV